jgi:hypothetical protein
MLVFVLALEAFPADAQFYFYNDKYYNTDWVVELGAATGIMNCLTDLGGKKGIGKKFIKDINWRVSKPSLSAYAVTTWHDVVGIRLEVSFGRIGSYDSILKNAGASTFGRYERNLSFRSNISEFLLAAELHPLFFKSYDEDDLPPLWSPYVTAGVGYFSFSPQAQLNNRWYDLQPLHTEGQGFKEYPDRQPYKLNQVNIPVGVGIKYEVSAIVNARLELLYRVLFTDYLDDVSNVDYIDPSLFDTYLPPGQAAIAQQLYARRFSLEKNNQRGDPKHNDAFFTIQLKLSLALRSARQKQ